MPSPHEHLLHEQSWERVGWGGTGRRAVQMKILQVLPALDQGGVEWDAVELALYRELLGEGR